MTSTRTRSTLTRLALGVASALALLGAAPAMASVVNFETVTPDFYLDGSTLSQSGYTMTTVDTHAGGGGLTGLLVNGQDASTCWSGGCPTNNTSLFYAGIADSALRIARDDGSAFSLSSLDYGFVAPVGGLADYSYGQLMLTGTLANGTTVAYAIDFPGTDSAGNPLFTSMSLASTFAANTLTSLSIQACLFDGTGACVVPHDIDDYGFNQAGFALDNLVLDDALAAVPEPGSLALFGLGIGALALRRRKPAAAANHVVNA